MVWSRFATGTRTPPLTRSLTSGRPSMQDSTRDVQNTGTLPGAGQGSVPVVGDGERRDRPGWVEDPRAGLGEPGKFLAYEDGGRHVVVAISREWTRIGRSLAADLRFDDATVSRRHALLASEEAGVRVLDDRLLTGIEVNGRRVEWSPLADGDAISIGRHVLYFLDTSPVAAAPGAAPATLAE